MTIRTISQSDSAALKMMINRQLLGMRTCMPGVIDGEPRRDGHVWVVDVLPAIQQIIEIDGERQYVDLPKLAAVPIVLPACQSLGLSITIPIKRGDECVLLVSDRSLDNWQLDGGIQRPADEVEIRHHDISDALCIPSALTIASLPSYNNDAIQIGSEFVNVAIDQSSVDIKAPTVSVSGNLNVSGTITAPVISADTSLTVDSVEMSEHKHPPGTYQAGPVAVAGQSGEPV